MDSHRVQKRLYGQAGLEGCGEALDDLAGDWADVVQAKDLLVPGHFGYGLEVAVTHALLGNKELCGLVVAVEDLDVVSTTQFDGRFLRHADATVF